MKKIYLTLGLTALLAGANAQQSFKIKNNFANGKHGKNMVARSGNNSVAQLAGGIICNNNYVAGTTMNLNFTIDLTNTDQEYCDSLAITFPAGFTINSTNATPQFPTNDNGTGVVRDNLNPIVGQTISWGHNDNGQYGGISAGPINFAINVTITATVTGVQSAPFYASGDTYGPSPGNLAPGTITINPAIPNDLSAIATITQIGCTASANNSSVLFEFRNKGTLPQTGFSVKYIVNGGAPVVETYTGTISAAGTLGDTAVYSFTTKINMVAGTVYNVKVLTALATDGDKTSDTCSTVGYNSMTVPYTTGFEAPNGAIGFGAQHVTGAGGSWFIDTQVPHTGVKDALLLSGVNGVSDDWLFTPCLDLTIGKTYQVKYWYACYKTSTIPGGGAIGIALLDSSKVNATAPTHIVTTIKPATTTLTAVTYAANWATVYKADSVTFVVPATGTYVLGFEGKNTVATNQAFLGIDDINIKDLGFTGISTVTNSSDLSIYPNPTTGLLNITTTATNATVEFYNVMGQNVMSKTLANGANTIDMGSLSDGVYSVRIMQNNTLTIGKIIKTN